MAEVEYESCAEELRLCVGEPILKTPSEARLPAPLLTSLPSPLLLSSDGAPAELVLSLDAWVVRDFREGVTDPDRGLGGRLGIRFGGCGKELMLIAFLNVFGGAAAERLDLALGKAVVDVEVSVGRLGTTLDADLRDLVGVETPPVLFRVFDRGSAGSALVGGLLLDGRGRGSVAAMVAFPLFCGKSVIRWRK